MKSENLLSPLNLHQCEFLYFVNIDVNNTISQVFGLLTKPLIRFMLPQPQLATGATTPGASTPKSVTVPLLGSRQGSEADIDSHLPRPNTIRALLTTPTHTVHRYWRKFDDSFMRPVFGGRGFVPLDPSSTTERDDSNHQWQ